MFLLPLLSLLISLLLGIILIERLHIKVSGYAWVSFIITLGIIGFTVVNYLFSKILPFPQSILVGQFFILIGEVFYLMINKRTLEKFTLNIKSFLSEKYLIVLILIIGAMLIALFHTHVLLNINGDLYTGESTYGDLPFHLSQISQIAYGNNFPPNNPLIVNHTLVYPYLVNFFSAILVYEGMSLRNSILIPGIILSLSLLGLIYDFAYIITQSKLKSFLTVLLFFFNGGLGFYYFLKDYSFDLSSIFQALSHPSQIKEYSHLFEQNIQWVNFLSRMIVPERSILLGIPAGIIILRLLFFRGNDKKISIFDILIASILLSLMPLLHTHTAIVFVIIIPILILSVLGRNTWKRQIISYLFIGLFTILFTLPHISTFLNHVGSSENFFKLHFGWMSAPNENFLWFWFKNGYLWIPLTLIALFMPKLLNKQIKSMTICGFILFTIMNLVLFSPYNWDNVKFLFWIGLFFSLTIASLMAYILQYKNLLFRSIAVLVILTFFSSAFLSLYREINLKYVLFSKEAVDLANFVKQNTPQNSIFLTYKVHNSPVSNLAGRQILMGYPGSLWVHGINYQIVDKDVNDMFEGGKKAKQLFIEYGVNYAVLENGNPESLLINRDFFNRYPTVYKSNNYQVYKIL